MPERGGREGGREGRGEGGREGGRKGGRKGGKKRRSRREKVQAVSEVILAAWHFTGIGEGRSPGYFPIAYAWMHLPVHSGTYFGLRYLIVMMRKLEVNSTSVNVSTLSQDITARGEGGGKREQGRREEGGEEGGERREEGGGRTEVIQ